MDDDDRDSLYGDEPSTSKQLSFTEKGIRNQDTATGSVLELNEEAEQGDEAENEVDGEESDSVRIEIWAVATAVNSLLTRTWKLLWTHQFGPWTSGTHRPSNAISCKYHRAYAEIRHVNRQLIEHRRVLYLHQPSVRSFRP
jgi:hypothetical protein